MKLRLRSDSLRLRLSQGEVRELADSGSVRASTSFGAQQRLEYQLRCSELEAPHACFEDGRIEISLPRAQALAWAASEEVSISASQALPEGSLHLLIEKDFQCLAPRASEEDRDSFEHPRAKSGAGC